MSDEYSKIMAMIKQQEGTGINEKKEKGGGLATMFAFFVIGLVGIALLSTLFWILFDHSQGRFVQGGLAQSFKITIPIAVLGLGWLGISYAAGAAQFEGEMMRRAWTNSQPNEAAYKDFRNTADYGSWIIGLFWAAVVFIVVAYYLK